MSTSVHAREEPGRISGSVILRKIVHRLAPRFAAACSIAGSMLASAAGRFRQHDRVERQRFDDHDAEVARIAEPVDRRPWLDEAERLRQRREHAEATEDLPQADRPDERRQDQRHQQQAADESLPGKSYRTLSSASGRRSACEERHADRDAGAVDQAPRSAGLGTRRADNQT